MARNFFFREIYHANQWHSDPRLASPMAILTDKSAVFLKDCVSFNHSSLGCVKGVIKKFFHKISVCLSQNSEVYPVAFT